MLTPADYAEDESALFHPLTRRLMQRIDFRHGGPEFDRSYPDGIPTTVEVDHAKLGPLSSGLVMYPEGHARCDDRQSRGAAGAQVPPAGRAWASTTPMRWSARFTNLADKSPQEIAALYDFEIRGGMITMIEDALTELARQVRARHAAALARAGAGLAHLVAARHLESHPLARRACAVGAGCAVRAAADRS